MKKIYSFCFLLWFIPCTLFAQGPAITLSNDTLNFGTVIVNSYESESFDLYNNGQENVTVSFGNISGTGSSFVLWYSGSSWQLGAGSSLNFSVTYHPTSVGILNAVATIYTPDTNYTMHFIGNVVAETYSISGILRYANTSNTLLNNITVNLMNSSATIVATTATSMSGNYSFGMVANGDYTLQVISPKPWGGVSAADVLAYRKHIANITPLSGIFLASGDVNASGSLTASDVLLISKRIAMVTNSFPAGDWLYDCAPITVNGGGVVEDFNGLVYGDANGSYTPPAK